MRKPKHKEAILPGDGKAEIQASSTWVSSFAAEEEGVCSSKGLGEAPLPL